MRARHGGGRDVMAWGVGLACGLGISVAPAVLLLPLGTALVIGGACGLAHAALRGRRRAVVWQEPPWDARAT